MNDPDPRRASDGFDQDAIFADIVAHLDGDETDPEGEVVQWADRTSAPDSAPDEPPDDQPPDNDRSYVDDPPALPASGHPQALPTPEVWRAHQVDDEYEEHFEPQPVAPLPVGDLQFWGHHCWHGWRASAAVVPRPFQPGSRRSLDPHSNRDVRRRLRSPGLAAAGQPRGRRRRTSVTSAG